MFPRSERSTASRHSRRPRHPMSVTLSALSALVLVGLVAGPTAGAAQSRATGTPPVIHGPSQGTTKVKAGPDRSPNWSGYAVSPGSFTDAAGSWVQPTATCPTNQQQDAAFWVGIDGFASSDDAVEQIGTDSDCNKGKKKTETPNYYAWWEFDTPSSSSSVTIPETVSPGDHMSADVSNANGTYTMTLTDSSTAHSSWQWVEGPVTPSPTPQAASAEWIGPDRILWASDYPHPDGVWPNSLSAVERQMKDLSPTLRQKLTHDNAAKLYGLN